MNFFLTYIPALFSILAVFLLIIILMKSSTKKSGGTEKSIREEFRLGRDESTMAARALRDEIAASLNSTNESVSRDIAKMGREHRDSFEAIEKRVATLTLSNEERLEKVRTTIDRQMESLRENNEKKLDQMRQTVDEKLEGTLNKRLGESFNTVSKQLEAVQRGLGEMRSLATGVGDLKRVLTNVKTRGTWGEVQLGAILDEILTPTQFEKNVATKPGSAERVEYAIKLPGADSDKKSNIWLPIDAKFPQEDYQRIISATEAADPEALEKASAALIRSIKNSAKDISTKYINPPETTDFA
ncbi:MAG: DNA recombination protein RmuC, partial [Proteobacteria bacterium]|nr:DNA recombination protein RmuC [Pseudomonadota bacterium]